MNRKGIGIVEAFVLTFVVATILGIGASKLHHQQRIEKQATAEGRAEYPIKEKAELTPKELIRNSLKAGK